MRAELTSDAIAESSARHEQDYGLLGDIAIRMAAAERTKLELTELVARAREVGITWTDIARAAGITPQAAQRRWDPEARRKHTEYQRQRSVANTVTKNKN
jgi:hypothetical protein